MPTDPVTGKSQPYSYLNTINPAAKQVNYDAGKTQTEKAVQPADNTDKIATGNKNTTPSTGNAQLSSNALALLQAFGGGKPNNPTASLFGQTGQTSLEDNIRQANFEQTVRTIAQGNKLAKKAETDNLQKLVAARYKATNDYNNAVLKESKATVAANSFQADGKTPLKV